MYSMEGRGHTGPNQKTGGLERIFFKTCPLISVLQNSNGAISNVTPRQKKRASSNTDTLFSIVGIPAFDPQM